MERSTIISITNQKGGVGKTTTAVHLTQSLAILGYKVLLVDMDPQANATIHIGLKHSELGISIFDVITQPGLPVTNAIYKGGSGFDILPGSVSLSELGDGFRVRETYKPRLREAISQVRDQYDYIILDSSPYEGALPFHISLYAADKVLVPIDCGSFALDGIKLLLARINQTQESVSHDLSVLGFLLTMTDGTNMVGAIADSLKEAFGSLVFEARIRRTVRLKEAALQGQTLFHYAPKNPAINDYMALAKEVCQKALKQTQASVPSSLQVIEGGVR